MTWRVDRPEPLLQMPDLSGDPVIFCCYSETEWVAHYRRTVWGRTRADAFERLATTLDGAGLCAEAERVRRELAHLETLP